MSKYHSAADVLKREAQRYVALSEAAKALDEIGSLDQAANEAKARAIAHGKEAELAKAEVDALKSNAAKMKEAQAAKLKEYDDIAAKAIFDANTRAGEIVAAAETSAKKIAADTELNAQGIAGALKQQIVSLEKVKSALSMECDALHEKSAALALEANTAEKRLAKVRENIAKLATA